MRHAILLAGFALLSVSACASPSNVRSANDYDAPKAPTVKHPVYDPYAPYGQANATWRPPVINRDGTIVKPSDAAEQAQRADYEHATWATGAAGGAVLAPPGTF